VDLDAESLRRANEVAEMVSEGHAQNAEHLFAPAFLGRLPHGGLGEVLSGLRSQLGRCAGIKRIESIGRSVVRYRMQCERGGSVDFDLVIEPSPPHRIETWLIRQVTPVEPSLKRGARALESVEKALSLLGAEAGMLLVELRGGDVVSHLHHQLDRPFLIGSLAKLCTFSMLLDVLDRRQLQWHDVAYIEETDRSLPTGSLAYWPKAAPLTVHTLATLLILDSDNTANDMLLRVLRDMPSSRQPDGICQAAMSTRQYFGLRAAPELSAQYAAATSPSEQRQILQRLPPIELEELAARFAASANRAPVTGWVATPGQMVVVLKRLHAQLREASAAPAREIFNASRKNDPLLASFPFVAAKGGTDRGLMSHGLIVETGPDATWLCVLVWNGHSVQPPQAYRDALQGALSAIANL